jgi:hypothetical protein
MVPAEIMGRLPLLRLRTAMDVVEDILDVKGMTWYSSEEEEEFRLRLDVVRGF